MDNGMRLTAEILFEQGTIPAVRFLRRQGLTFRTARTTVAEMAADAKWFRKYTRKPRKEAEARFARAARA